MMIDGWLTIIEKETGRLMEDELKGIIMGHNDLKEQYLVVRFLMFGFVRNIDRLLLTFPS